MKGLGLFYCTKDKPYLHTCENGRYNVEYEPKGTYEILESIWKCKTLNGLVVAEFEFDVELVNPDDEPEMCENWDWLTEGAHIHTWDISKGYAIHIKNVKVLEPYRKLDEFETGKWVEYRYGPVYWFPDCKPIKNPRTCEVQHKEFGSRILFPIKPEDLRNILNGEQNMLFRKRLPKEITNYGRF